MTRSAVSTSKLHKSNTEPACFHKNSW